jgi:hypothetical protein
MYVACRLLWFMLALGSRHDLPGSALTGAAAGAVGTLFVVAIPIRSQLRPFVGGAALAVAILMVLYAMTPPHLRVAFDKQTYMASLRLAFLFHFVGSTAALALALNLMSWLATRADAVRAVCTNRGCNGS